MMIKTPLELYKHLDQSNCRRCMLPSCMAFSVAVIQGQKKLSDCPLLNEAKINELSG
ncbi:MAG: Fe-S cluster protein, partial [Candidatus Electrothrix sp. AUS4]|nr:Fe-S cluster protein [Candidatus Electrothrix sp. AUS4]